MLNEIEAYGVSRDDLFYAKSLSVNDYIALTRAGLSAQVRAFQSLWQHAGTAVQEEVADWAWEVPWMRVRMIRSNRPAQEGNTWNLTCVALQRKLPTGASLCGRFSVAEP
jgi:hypothetical protein